MKTKYFKGITAISLVAVLFLSSCLKDKRYFDPESVTSNVAELPLSGLANFSKDAVTKAGIDTVIFAVGVTAATPPTSPTTINIGVDNTIITTYNAANSTIVYQPIPTAAYKLPVTAVTIPAGKNSTLTTVIIDRTQLDPAASYMLPIKIVNAGGITISANFGIHYFHIIGNDFAGTYTHYYSRFNAADSTSVAPTNNKTLVNAAEVISPVTSTQFEVKAYYYSSPRYEVTYTKTGTGSTATYSNFAISLNADDIATATTLSSGGVTFNAPAFADPQSGGLSPSATYTYAQVIQRLKFVNLAASSGSPRYTIDKYVHN